MKRPGFLATTALLLAVAAAAAPAPAPTPRATAAAAPAAGSALTRPLPPSVLARIITLKGSTDIKLSDFNGFVRQMGGSTEGLTPPMREQVLELLIERRMLATEAKRSGRHWTHADSLDFSTYSDRLTLKAALDSAMADMGFRLAGAGRNVPDQDMIGLMLRDSAVAAMSPVYDEATIGLLGAAFAALPQPHAGMSVQEQLRVAAQLPTLSAADSARAVVRTRDGTYTAGELLADFGRLDPTYRPPVRNAEQVRDLANSTLYERLLREHARAQRLARRPAIAAAVAEHAEMLDVQRWLATNAYDKVPIDTLTLRRQFKANPERYDAPGSADVVHLTTDTRAQADSLARRLRVPSEAESLEAQSQRAGVPFRAVLVETADSTLYARVRRAGVGAVLGPDSTAAGWRVLRVLTLEPRHPRRFDDAYELVKADWFQRDGEHRAQALVGELRSHTIVNVNNEALARLGTSTPGPAPAGRKRSPR